MQDRVKRAAHAAEAERYRRRLQVYIDDPSWQGCPRMRREADLYIAKRELGRMHLDNHQDVKQGAQPRWSDEEISACETAIEVLTTNETRS